jgi:hypothetical protein
MGKQNERRYWVVSPNVRNVERTAPEWTRASILGRAAFMGWGPNDSDNGKGAGHKFAHLIAPGDVILIARRHDKKPDLCGFGVVQGSYRKRISGKTAPDTFGSCRMLKPFVSLVGVNPKVPIGPAITQTTALAELHEWNSDHKRICDWMDQQIQGAHGQTHRKIVTPKDKPGTTETDAAGNYQLDYLVRTSQQVKRAIKKEERLMQRYREWLSKSHKTLPILNYGRKLRCDGYEVVRRNLIEAKSSAKREYIRMAVGQLLDYAHLGKEDGYERPHMAFLLPNRPDKSIEDWLESLQISVIWPLKKAFSDNARGQFV